MLARKQEARFWELRSAVSLVPLLVGRGRSADARALLAPIHDGFTEGLDMPDLVQARALLATL